MEFPQGTSFPRHVILSIILLIILANLPAQTHARRKIHPRGSHTRDFAGPGFVSSNRRTRGWLPPRGSSTPTPPNPPQRGDIPITSSDSDTEFPGEAQLPDEFIRAVYGVYRQLNKNGEECVDSSCHPKYGNILVGRQRFLNASSTCGLDRQVTYCLISRENDASTCEYCDSRDDKIDRSHRVTKISDLSSKDTWWQAENGKENVTIEFNLDAEFQITYIIIRFRTFVPAAMFIERSYDFGKTWQVYEYFAHDCSLEFPGIPAFPPKSLDQVICTERYSKMTPTRDGKVVLRPLVTYRELLPNRSAYSNEVLNLVKATNIRLNLVKLHTLGHDKLDNRPTTAEKYYFAINGMNIRGMCSCYGHSSECIPAPGEEEIPEMVYGVCNCSHYTGGKNCDKCLDFYNDAPWKPAFGNETNACKRCECNNHASACHFDEAVYIESGNRSGGVCDGCQHFTTGKNCELCMPFYYRDPSKDLTDHQVCKQCDCEPGGSIDGGECDRHTNIYYGFKAGHCHCKRNVQGARCDTCKHGHWNFKEDNPEGCEGCHCSPDGTQDGSCDAVTGFCDCKRFVDGKYCNQCMRGYWGLTANNKHGCQPCNCSGGAVDNMCDTITGQCKCFAHMTGRTCDQPNQGYFIPMPFIKVEAENAEISEGCILLTTYVQSDVSEEKPETLTTLRCPTSNSTVVFPVQRVPKSSDYEIVLRYNTFLKSASKATIIVQGEGPNSDESTCRKQWKIEEDAIISLDSDSNFASARKVCLDRKKTYKIRISFKELIPAGTSSAASALINIDSIILVPKVPGRITEAFGESPVECIEFIKQNADSVYPEYCHDVYKNFGVIIYEGALPCGCNVTGSTSMICSSLGGQCTCKTNVAGRQCNRCEHQHYAFGPTGCQACDCNSHGSLGGQCDVQTGQCKCRTGAYGLKCDRCQPGFWNFPNCKRCECNGHAIDCDPVTGSCLYCQNNTMGSSCDKCVDGFYGDPRLSEQIACRPCPCPGTADTGHIFARRCALGVDMNVVCECAMGYTGDRCDKCADNFYGSPEVEGGSCKVCDCNNNIDVTKPGSCDRHTGVCHNCLFNSEGPQCELCKDGFYKNENNFCTECVCNGLGTTPGSHCNKTTGQCDCLPNVVGLKCDSCRENYWKLASGKGCEPCDCNPDGSLSTECNEFDGRCKCKPGLGGRKCDSCPRNHWGNPKINCRKCECDAAGSAANQCDPDDGHCNCLTGVNGYNCNECARGYSGNVPYCRTCGECFHSWDRTLAELKEKTIRLVRNGSELSATGISGAYSHDFTTINERINNVKRTLDRETTPGQLDQLQRTVDQIRADMQIVAADQLDVEQISRNISERILFSRLSIDDLERKLASLRSSLDTLRRNATRLQESDIHGALNLIKDATQRSANAQNEAKEHQKKSHEAERQCQRAEGTLDAEQLGMEFTTKQDENIRALTEAQRKLDRLQERLPDINDLVCSDRGNPCSDLCGGGGCSTCGGLSCDGAVDKAKHAAKYAQEADKLIREKDARGELLLKEINIVMEDSEKSYKMAQDTVQNVNKIGQAYNTTLAEHAELANRANVFLAKSQPAGQIRTKIVELQAKAIPFEQEEILELARNIKDTVRSLTDIDSILEETHEDKLLVNKLRYDAERTRLVAEFAVCTCALLIPATNLKTQKSLDLPNSHARFMAVAVHRDAAMRMANTSQVVVNALKRAQEAQEIAEIALQNATKDADIVAIILPQISKLANDAHSRTNRTLEDVRQLEISQKQLQSRFLKTSGDVQETKVEASLVQRDSNIAIEGANTLRTEHEQVLNRIKNEAFSSNETRIEAEKLLERAANFSFQVNSQLRQLQDMEISYEEYGKTAATLSDEVEQLTKTVNQYLIDIIAKSRYYHSCMS